MNPWRIRGGLLLVLGAAAGPPLGAQLASRTRHAPTNSEELIASANFGPNAVDADGVVELTLNRPLTPAEGELALVVGGTDVTAIAERTPSRISYRASAVALATGQTEVVLYRRAGRQWSEIRRFAMTVTEAAAGGASTDESATLGNTGQLAEGHSSTVAAAGRRRFQDFVLNAGVHSSQQTGGVAVTTQSNYVGVTQREQALRFATLADRAPMLDLSDYLVTVQRSSAALSVGHISFGTSRHLANGFASRGGTFTLTQGATTMTVGALDGSAQVGWDNIIGLEQPTNRVFGAAIGREMVASHPGALRLDATFIDGTKAPVSSFTRAAVVDAERSGGGSVQLTTATPDQRLRLTGGFTRSRFENPANDPQLVADSLTKRPRAATRGARFVELSAAVLQNTAVPLVGPTSITLGLRDERVDPLFGSIAAATTADRQQTAADGTITLGAITAQGSQSWGRDNLANVASILTTNTMATTGSIALPVAKLVGVDARAAWLPVIAVGLNRTHQLAAGTPTNGAFRAQDLPDQVSTSGDVTAQWQIGRVRAALHTNRAGQDNREDQRQNADFASGVDGLTVGSAVGSGGDVSLDAANEFQFAKERNEMTRVHRLTLNGTLHTIAALNVAASLSAVETHPPAGATSLNGEQHLELSRALRLWPGASGAERGQAFVRYSRTNSIQPDPTVAPLVTQTRITREQWTVASGLNFKLF